MEVEKSEIAIEIKDDTKRIESLKRINAFIEQELLLFECSCNNCSNCSNCKKSTNCSCVTS